MPGNCFSKSARCLSRFSICAWLSVTSWYVCHFALLRVRIDLQPKDFLLSLLHECIKVLLACLVAEAGVVLATIPLARQVKRRLSIGTNKDQGAWCVL